MTSEAMTAATVSIINHRTTFFLRWIVVEKSHNLGRDKLDKYTKTFLSSPNTLENHCATMELLQVSHDNLTHID